MTAKGAAKNKFVTPAKAGAHEPLALPPRQMDSGFRRNDILSFRQT